MIQLSTIARHLGPLAPEHEGSLDIFVKEVCSPLEAKPDSIVFISHAHLIPKSLAGDAAAFVFDRSAKGRVDSLRELLKGRTAIYSPEPERAMREVLVQFFASTPYINLDFDEGAGPGIHPTAIVHPSVRIGSRVRIGAYSIIGSHVVLGDDVTIAPHVNIEPRAVIGARSVVHPFVYIGHSCEIGSDCEINPNTTVGKEGFGYANDLKFNHFRIPHQGRVVLEDRVHLGASNTIDRGTFGDTRIGAGSVLDNQVHIAHNSSLGANSVVTAGFRLAGSTKIGKNFVVGGNSVVTGHIEVCDNVQLSAVSAVSKAIDKPGKYGGNPLLPLQDHLKMKVAMTKLPLLLKKLRLEL